MLIRNATLADGRRRDVRVRGEQIAAVESNLDAATDETVIDATGKHLLPGMIDVHVHFREPGYSYKETWETGSKSAVAGGVTTVVDQPNTDPPTINRETFDGKLDYATKSLVDFGINGGVTADWEPEALLESPLFALGEVFLADSTGEMGIDSDLFETAVKKASDHGISVTVHAEDATKFDEETQKREDADAWSAFRTAAAEAAAVERACGIGRELETTIHIAHTSTPEGIDIATEHGMTCEVSPHHLLLSREDLSELGTHGRMNPPLRSETRRQAVYDRVRAGKVEMIATDHAPHTREEKDTSIWEAPSGVPGVETALPLLLAEVRDGVLSLETVRELTAENPAVVFDLPQKGRIAPGKDADLVLVDLDAVSPIRSDDLHTRCDWTPFEGWDGVFPEWTMLRGEITYRRESDSFGEPRGKNVRA